MTSTRRPPPHGRSSPARGSWARQEPRRRHSRRAPRDRLNIALPLALAVAAASLGVLTLLSPPFQAAEPAGEDSEGAEAPNEGAPEPRTDAHAELPAAQATDVPVLLRSVVEPVDSADGQLETVPGEGEILGEGSPRTFIVEVESGLPGDAGDFAAAVEEILGDPRSWGGDGEMSFQRVEDSSADFRVALAAPDTTDRLCAPLNTAGRLSCHNNGRAVINQNRWVGGVESYEGDIAAYRAYVINHEVGHALGHGHVGCPGEGEPAPVMQQQTLGLQGCAPNGWVHPED